MGAKGNVCVGRVSHGEVGNEVVEAAVVCLSDEGNLFKELLGGLPRLKRDAGDENEAEAPLEIH